VANDSGRGPPRIKTPERPSHLADGVCGSGDGGLGGDDLAVGDDEQCHARVPLLSGGGALRVRSAPVFGVIIAALRGADAS